MYEANPDMGELRQGDIISEVYLPKFNMNEVGYLQKMGDDGLFKSPEHAVMTVTCQYVAVISQCCEFTADRRNSFSLAGLIDMRRRPSRDWRVFGINLAEIVSWKSIAWNRTGQLDLLKANTFDPETGTVEYVNSYFLRPDGTHLKDVHAIDFTRVFSVRIKDKAKFIRNKVLQLDDDNRLKLQQKLAYFYARPALDAEP